MVASLGLCKGVEVVLLSPTTYTPSWVEKGSQNHFIQHRGKLKELMQAKSEIEKFIESKAPDDNQLLVAYKQAGKKDDDCFGKDFPSSLMEFSQEMARKNNAQEKVESRQT